MTTTREEAARELHTIIMEADAYARLHQLNMMAFIEGEGQDEYNVITHATPVMMGEFCLSLWSSLPGEVQSRLTSHPEEPQEPEVKWSLLWGLFKKYK